MKTQKINYQKLADELEKMSYKISIDELLEILSGEVLTRSKFKIKQLSKKLKKKLTNKVKTNHLLEAISRSQFLEKWHVLNKQIDEHHLLIESDHFECDGFVLNYNMILDYSTFDSEEERIINQSYIRMMDEKDIESCIQFVFRRDKKLEDSFAYSPTRIFLKLWPEAVIVLKKKLDSLNFKITVDDMKEVMEFYKNDIEKKEKISFPLKENIVLLYGYGQSNCNLASSELLNMYNYYNERISKQDLLKKYIEYKNKKKEYEERLEKEKKDFRKRNIFFNIWDDYSDDETETFGRFEDDKYFLKDNTRKDKAMSIIKNEILKLYPKLNMEKKNDELIFYNLNHKTRESLVKALNKSKFSYKGLSFHIYSES